MNKHAARLGLSLGLLFAAQATARADEGMWTFNQFPSAKVKELHGVAPDAKWLDHVRRSSLRLAGGCSASFVSGSGLVATNHHCASSCIQQVSTADNDHIKNGFYAKAPSEEVKCPEIEFNNLVEITDVTDRINKATQGLADQKFNDAQKAEMSNIEKACSTSADVRCDVVSLYHGGVFNLYKYKRFQDVRLVFAPEFAIAFFGGDPDNFNFPRYDLDVSFLRVYENGKPAKIDQFFKWSPAAVKEGDATFVSGNPGGTSRALTVAELEYVRDAALPDRLLRLAELRGLLTQFAKTGPEQKRISNHDLFGVENAYKALRGRLSTLTDKQFFAGKVAEEQALRAKVNDNADWKAKYGDAWDAIAKAEAELAKIRYRYAYVEGGQGFQSQLFQIARMEVRAGDERGKPIAERFREFRDSNLPALTQQLFSSAPIYDELETVELTFSLGKLRELLGADDPFVKKVLGKKSPDELAAELVKGTHLKDVELRKKLWEGGKAAVDADNDPMIAFVKLIDGDARAVRKQFEDNIESVLKKNDERVAKARFAAQGTSTYPDATFTPRLSFGAVKGYEENGHHVAPTTTIGGAFDRATGRPPFDLPESWMKAKDKLDMASQFDFCADNDIIGGNSGSPVINKDAQVVGLVFDGNIQSLGGDYGFDATVNRMVAVSSAAILEALDKIYGAERIVKELRSGK